MDDQESVFSESRGEQGRRPEHEVRIHINREPYYSPNPTTGGALYKLGKVPEGFELYREEGGDHEDKPIPDGDETVHLKEDEHFYSEKCRPRDITIIVNGERKTVRTTELSFDQVVDLAFNPRPQGPNIVFTITYRKGPKENPEGTLVQGGVVKIKDGMVFNVTATDKS
jgi:hypothetical protein